MKFKNLLATKRALSQCALAGRDIEGYLPVPFPPTWALGLRMKRAPTLCQIKAYELHLRLIVL